MKWRAIRGLEIPNAIILIGGILLARAFQKWRFKSIMRPFYSMERSNNQLYGYSSFNSVSSVNDVVPPNNNCSHPTRKGLRRWRILIPKSASKACRVDKIMY